MGGLKKQARWCETTIVTAAKRHGKSTLVEQMVRNHFLPNALIYKEGVNLYDEAFKKYPVINSLKEFKGGKVIVNGGYVKYKDFLIAVNKKFRNGIIVIDDAAEYERNEPTDELMPILINSRKLGIELVFVYHGFSDIPIRMFKYTNNIISGYTNDGFAYKGSRLPNGGKDFEAMQQRIHQQWHKGNIYYKELLKIA